MPQPESSLHAAVEVRSVHHAYGNRPALHDISFTVPQGSLFALLGPNGSGKTTLFRILSTLIRPSRGNAEIFGHSTTLDSDAVRRNLGVIFQEPALDDALTVEENLRFHAALYGISGRVYRERAGYVKRMMGVADRANDRVSTLSGGLRRRVDLARGLLHAPRLLLLDEPTHGLDPIARRELWNGLQALRRQDGTTIVVATHLLDEADACDEIVILHEGRIAVSGAPAVLKSAVGGETLWLSSQDPGILRERIEARFGVDARIIGRSVQVSHPEAHNLLASLYESQGELIESATVRRPTLEDVFMVSTGYRFALEEAHMVEAEH